MSQLLCMSRYFFQFILIIKKHRTINHLKKYLLYKINICAYIILLIHSKKSL